MKKTALVIGMLLASMSVFPQWADSSQGLVGKKGYDFELEDVHGNQVTRSDFEGKIVILDFWAVWCGPCQLSLPLYQKLADKYGSKDVVVVGVHVEDRMPPVEDLRDYLEARKVRYTNLVSTRKVDNAYQIYAMPTTYILDRNGRIQKMHMGFDPRITPADLESDLLELLN